MPKRALVIEPDVDAVARIESSLCSAGYGVSFVRDASTAVTEARRQRPDIIVTELALREIDGLKLVRLLRDDPTCRSRRSSS